MRAFINSRGTHPERFRAHRLLNAMGMEYTIVVNNEEGLAGLKRLGLRGVSAGIDTYAPIALNKVREFIRKELTKPGEWYFVINDNVDTLTNLDPSTMPMRTEERIEYDDADCADWSEAFNRVISPKEVAGLIGQIHRKCLELKTAYGGVTDFSNPFFRKARWARYRLLVRGHFFVTMNDGMSWDPSPELLTFDDVYRSLWCLREYGCNVTDRFSRVIKTENEPGGVDHNIELHRRTVPYLVKKFKGLIEPIPGHEDWMRLVPKNGKQIRNWRLNNASEEA